MIKNKNLIQSFQSAIKGLKDAFICERDFRIIVAGTLVIGPVLATVVISFMAIG